MLITNKNVNLPFRGSSHFGPSFRHIPLLTETCARNIIKPLDSNMVRSMYEEIFF